MDPHVLLCKACSLCSAASFLRTFMSSCLKLIWDEIDSNTWVGFFVNFQPEACTALNCTM